MILSVSICMIDSFSIRGQRVRRFLVVLGSLAIRLFGGRSCIRRRRRMRSNRGSRCLQFVQQEFDHLMCLWLRKYQCAYESLLVGVDNIISHPELSYTRGDLANFCRGWSQLIFFVFVHSGDLDEADGLEC